MGMKALPTGRTLVMGIVNCTPDSFSDGGLWFGHDAAVGRARQLIADGADLIDVGGESTRPGSDRVSLDDELARVVPVVKTLAAEGIVVSVDTTRAEVAQASIDAGADWINDVSGGLADPAMLGVVAASGRGYISMHWRAHSAHMQALATYDDVVTEVASELKGRRDAALAAGIDPGRLVLDPGLGFSKDADHNWQILQHWDAFEALGFPLLLAASRKRFLGELLASGGQPRPPRERDAATAALTTMFAQRGTWGVRTHAVRAHRDAIAVVERMGRKAL